MRLLGLCILLTTLTFVRSFLTSRVPFLHDGSLGEKRSTSSVLFYKSSSDTTGNEFQVMYQKVVRQPSTMEPNMLLHFLVEYLQDHFELPKKLPMVYSVVTTNDDESNSVVQWDSSLSPSPDQTCLNVQVVAISSPEGRSLDASMAMVVVGKRPTAKHTLPTLLKGLFKDSERQILKALDRGLQDFMDGKIRFPERRPSPEQEAKDSILTELVDSSAIQTSRGSESTGDIAEAEIVSKTMHKDEPSSPPKDFAHDKQHQKQYEAPKPAVKSTPSKTIKPSAPGLDFAVQQAKLAAARRAKRKPQEEFAVKAAKKAAERRKQSTQAAVKKDKVKPEADFQTPIMDVRPPVVNSPDPLKMDTTSIRPPSLQASATGTRRTFRTVSTPQDFHKMRQVKDKQKGAVSDNTVQPPKEVKTKTNVVGNDASEHNLNVSVAEKEASRESTTETVPRNSAQPPQKVKTRASALAKDTPKEDLRIPVAEERESKGPTKETPKRKLNLNVREKDRTIDAMSHDESDDVTDPKQKEIIEGAQQALTEMEEQGEDLSAEDLLRQVMQFGDEQELQEQDGAGFVSGAFEKAKDLLREQKQKRDERIQEQMRGDPESVTGFAEPNIGIEDELRRMFAAGEQLADGRITKVEAAGGLSAQDIEDNQEELDELINSDRTVSKNVRQLDDELAELEMKINKSPDEGKDGPQKAPVFDIFSGPEVYNPNVDPENAVNWPGAKHGTNTKRLPNDLQESVKQAQFASKILQNMETIEIETADGQVETGFMIGERRLSTEQVENMQLVANEAIQIGLIDNPLVLAKESSQIQMLVDELWNLPEERCAEVMSHYKELLLSENFVTIIKQRLNALMDKDLVALRDDNDDIAVASSHERKILSQLVVGAQLLLKEAQALGAELEAQQLEVIRSICKVAMDPRHQTEEETAMALTDAVRDMRPLFDEAFIAYLKYAVAEEEGRLARAGLLDDPAHSQWLFVLRVVQQGVYTEIGRGISRYIDHLRYVLRMETAFERRELLKNLIDDMPTLDVRPFVQTVENIVASLGDSVQGNFDGATELGEMTKQLLQLHRDMRELLPEERIVEKSRDADEWAARQRKRLKEERESTRKRLRAAQETEHLDNEIETLGMVGEVDRFD